MKIIPFSDPGRENNFLKEEIIEAINEVIVSGWYVLGQKVEEFEKLFSSYIGVGNCTSCGNGTDALVLALNSVGVTVDDEVIVPSHTAGATISAIHSVGAIPVYCDIDPTTYCIDPIVISQCITKKTKAIIPVHIYGHPADMESILKIAQDNNLKVVEDCAQALGAKINGRHVGTFGDVSTFSFYPTKNLGALGDGGAVFSNNKSYIDSARRCRQYGWIERYNSSEKGWNSRLDEMQAAVLIIKLKHLEKFNHLRRNIALFYNESLSNSSIILPSISDNFTHAWHLYVAQTENRDEIIEKLLQRGIQTGIHYPIPCHQQTGHMNPSKIGTHMIRTENASKKILSLPMHPFLEERELENITKEMKEILFQSGTTL